MNINKSSESDKELRYENILPKLFCFEAVVNSVPDVGTKASLKYSIWFISNFVTIISFKSINPHTPVVQKFADQR